MKITVRYFASIREAVGQGSEVLDTSATTLGALRDELLARGGYAASGVVHLLLGALAVGVTFGGRGQTDQSGAFRTIATAPWGMALL